MTNIFFLQKWSYLLDLIVMPFVIAFLVYMSPHTIHSLELISVGVIGWTLLEYFIHRVIFHHFPYFEELHDVHHRHPKAWVGVATYGTAAGFGLIWSLMFLFSGMAVANLITSGVIFGYLTYSVVHIQYHHGMMFDPMGGPYSWYMNYMANYHNGHHRGGQYNFGVTSPIWDIIFGTFKSARN